MKDRRPLLPSPGVVRFAPLISRTNPVLDLACGNGRHARIFAARNHEVVALDRNADALTGLASETGIAAVLADLESRQSWPFAAWRFSGIVVTNNLYRPLFPAVLQGLASDGVLIYETFGVGNEVFGKPSNPNYLLRPGELLDVIGKELRVVAFEQGEVNSPRPAVVQRLCAVRTPSRAFPALP